MSLIEDFNYLALDAAREDREYAEHVQNVRNAVEAARAALEVEWIGVAGALAERLVLMADMNGHVRSANARLSLEAEPVAELDLSVLQDRLARLGLRLDVMPTPSAATRLN